MYKIKQECVEIPSWHNQGGQILMKWYELLGFLPHIMTYKVSLVYINMEMDYFCLV